jgi:galactonate dehydratase
MKLAEIEAIPVRLERARERSLGTAGSPTPLAQGAGSYRWSPTVPALYSVHFETALVKITADNGLVGWGEAQAPLAPEVACEIVRLLLAPVLRDAEFDGSIDAIRCLWDRMYETMRVRGHSGGFMLDAISGVDIALWDLAGEFQERPVSEMLGAKPPVSVPAYHSGVPGATVDEAVAAARRASAEGFHLFKLFHDADAAALWERLDALAAALPMDTRYAVDALWRLNPESAAAFGAKCDRRNLLWLEAPLPPEDAEAHRALAQAIRTPLAVGESYRTAREVAPFLTPRAIGFLQPDLGRCGITEFLRIAESARAAGAEVVPHVSIALGPQIAAAVHVAAAAGCPWLEYNPNVLSVANLYLRQPLVVADAAYQVSRTPGLGIEMDEDKLRRRLKSYS